MDALLRKVKASKKAVQKWQSAAVLVVDEVSMLSSHFFDKLEEIARTIRNRHSHLPFGGLQLILCGDFFQLPPVTGNFCFRAKSWRRVFKPENCLQLTRVFRQRDPKLTRLLDDVRSCPHQYTLSCMMHMCVVEYTLAP